MAKHAMDPKARKVELRREVVAKILAMDAQDRRDQEASLARRFETLPGFADARVVLLYVSVFPEEFDTFPLLRRAVELGKRLVLPTVHRPSRTLRLFEVADLDHDLVPGHKGIPEPVATCPQVDPSLIDWVLVPGLGFDERGHRLGRGAGHYDKLLPTLRRDVPRWALILKTQWVEDLPVESHDQPLDGVADGERIAFGVRQ